MVATVIDRENPLPMLRLQLLVPAIRRQARGGMNGPRRLFKIVGEDIGESTYRVGGSL